MKVIRIRSLAKLIDCYRLRHLVYCEELGYESEVITKCEMDIHDAHATHFAVTNEEHELIGYFRLLTVTTQIHVASNYHTEPVPKSICEISRVTIKKEYRGLKTIHELMVKSYDEARFLSSTVGIITRSKMVHSLPCKTRCVSLPIPRYQNGCVYVNV